MWIPHWKKIKLGEIHQKQPGNMDIFGMMEILEKTIQFPKMQAEDNFEGDASPAADTYLMVD